METLRNEESLYKKTIFSDNLSTTSNELEKHKKYSGYYVANDVYWGLGIENEMYLEFDKPKLIDMNFFLNNHKRERYSVDYYSNYKPEYLKTAFQKYSNVFCFHNKSKIPLPLLINAHTFTKTDRNNEPIRMYTKACELNHKFCGETLFEEIIKRPVLSETYEKEWCFDGDTFEFSNMNFYNTTLDKVLDELKDNKTRFLKEIQTFQREHEIFKNYGNIQYMKQNYPFSVHMTNLNNVAMFNNGTLQYNITLPTRLTQNGKIANKRDFVYTHKNAIRLIQWFEPLLIAVYNTPDPFSENGKNPAFSNCSQRCAISRYMGIGTYDTDIMIEGKVLTLMTTTFDKYENWWYNRFHKTSNYNRLTEIGLDINFYKHYNHGIEIRFFDYIHDENLLQESFEFIIHLMDFVLDSKKEIENPIYSDLWNDLVLEIITKGNRANITEMQMTKYFELVGLTRYSEIPILGENIVEFYYTLMEQLTKRYYEPKDKHTIVPVGKFSKLCLTEKIISEEMMEAFFPEPSSDCDASDVELDIELFDRSVTNNNLEKDLEENTLLNTAGINLPTKKQLKENSKKKSWTNSIIRYFSCGKISKR